MMYADEVFRLLRDELVFNPVFGEPDLRITSVVDDPLPDCVLNLRVGYVHRDRQYVLRYPFADWEDYADTSPEGMAAGLANLVRSEVSEEAAGRKASDDRGDAEV